jgi:glucosamine-6-phosphate isomerase
MNWERIFKHRSGIGANPLAGAKASLRLRTRKLKNYFLKMGIRAYILLFSPSVKLNYRPMILKISPSYELMSRQAARDLLQILSDKTNPLICTASGHSPAGMYRELVKEIKQQQTDISSWKFVGLDEWAGMNEHDQGSCSYDLQELLFKPLGIKKEQLCLFDGRAADRQAECRRVEDFLEAAGGIEVAILGIGLNGHLGMNEPGTDPAIRTHESDIHPLTQETGQKYFASPQDLSLGLTMGLPNLLEARHVYLLANGAHKAQIISRAISAAPSPQLPATLLQQHKQATFYLDQEAASLLES